MEIHVNRKFAGDNESHFQDLIIKYSTKFNFSPYFSFAIAVKMLTIPTVKSCGPFKLNICGLMIGFFQLFLHSFAFVFNILHTRSVSLGAVTCKYSQFKLDISTEVNDILHKTLDYITKNCVIEL